MAASESRKPAREWAEELSRLNERLKDKYREMDVGKTELFPGWDQGKDKTDRWQILRKEWDRILIIKTELGWLSVDAAARVDRRLRAAGEIIDATIEGKVREAALKLRQAEHIIQRAWWSRLYNSWPSPWIFPMWAILSLILLAALGATVWVIFWQNLFPRGEEVGLHEALFGATLWGFGGAIVSALRTLHIRVQGQEFERERVAWYVLSPIIGLAFGAIVFLLFLAGLLSTGQELVETAKTTNQQGGSGATINPAPILLLAVLAGLAQNAFVSTLQQIIKARFRGAAEEEETSA